MFKRAQVKNMPILNARIQLQSLCCTLPSLCREPAGWKACTRAARLFTEWMLPACRWILNMSEAQLWSELQPSEGCSTVIGGGSLQPACLGAAPECALQACGGMRQPMSVKPLAVVTQCSV